VRLDAGTGSASLGLTNNDLVNQGRVELAGNNAYLGDLSGFTGALVNEAGGVVDVQPGSGTASVSTRLDNRGLVSVGRKVGFYGQGSVNRGTINLVNGATMTAGSGSNHTFTNDVGGVIEGNGTLMVGPNFTDHGTLSPGNSFGRIDIVGSYVQEADGILDLEIGATGQDELFITGGTGLLNGTLRLIFLGGFAPSLGDTFNLIGGDVTENFAQVTFVNLEPGFQYSLSGGVGGLQLTALNDAIASVPEPASVGLVALSVLLLGGLRRRRCAGEECG